MQNYIYTYAAFYLQTQPTVMKVFLPALIIFLLACNPSAPRRIPKPGPNTQTYVPIYMPSEQARQVLFQPPRDIVKSGKIYAIGNYLLQVETDSGIHVIDFTNRAAPQKVGFIKSLYCTEMAIKGNFLYINNVNDLVALDISNLSKPEEVKRIRGAFPEAGQYPPAQNTFFECPDAAKGDVIGWRRETRDYPKCYR